MAAIKRQRIASPPRYQFICADLIYMEDKASLLPIVFFKPSGVQGAEMSIEQVAIDSSILLGEFQPFDPVPDHIDVHQVLVMKAKSTAAELEFQALYGPFVTYCVIRYLGRDPDGLSDTHFRELCAWLDYPLD